ncbi:T9SS type A sorting domain-containing protein [candidate division KSB1 bacterium]|nr:T9SS type A sorting domain-containing protein [candidate division KSB1 bacterium]
MRRIVTCSVFIAAFCLFSLSSIYASENTSSPIAAREDHSVTSTHRTSISESKRLSNHYTDVATIIITPANPTMYIGQTITFTAEGRDKNGNPVPILDPNWEGDGSSGTITPIPGSNPPQCTYTATNEGNGYVICYEGPPPQGGVNGSTDIKVNAGSYLARIEVSPSNVSLQVGQTQQFTATGYDQDNNVYQVDPIWSADGDSMGSDGSFKAKNVGDFTVTAADTQWNISGNAYVHVDPATSVSFTHETPGGFALYQNFPNPFNPETTISFSLPSRQKVILKLYDMTGKEISTLIDDEFPGGTHSFRFLGSDLASGVYLYKITMGNYTATRKFILLR